MQHSKMFISSVFLIFFFFFLKLQLRAGEGDAGGERENRDSSFPGLPFQKRDTETAILGTI